MADIEIKYFRQDHHIELGNPPKVARVFGTNRAGPWKILVETRTTLSRAEKAAVEAWVKAKYEGEVAEVVFRLPSTT